MTLGIRRFMPYVKDPSLSDSTWLRHERLYECLHVSRALNMWQPCILRARCEKMGTPSGMLFLNHAAAHDQIIMMHHRRRRRQKYTDGY